MRPLLAFAVLVATLAGCTPEIPVKPQFGTSASKPIGAIPPEFAAFDNYNPAISALLADQICATPYVLEVEKTTPAVPGAIVAATGRCRTYAPFFTSSNELTGR